MKFLILILIVPWILIPIFYNRLTAFKKTNLAIRKELDSREERLKRVARKIADADQLSEKIEEYKNALASAQIEHAQYKKDAESQIKLLEEKLAQTQRAE